MAMRGDEARQGLAVRIRRGDPCPIQLINHLQQYGGRMAEYAQVAATRGTIPDLTSEWLQPEEEVWYPGQMGKPPIRWNCTVYTDGSCHLARGTNGDRAGYGVVYIRSDGTVAASVPRGGPATPTADGSRR